MYTPKLGDTVIYTDKSGIERAAIVTRTYNDSPTEEKPVALAVFGSDRHADPVEKHETVWPGAAGTKNTYRPMKGRAVEAVLSSTEDSTDTVNLFMDKFRKEIGEGLRGYVEEYRKANAAMADQIRGLEQKIESLQTAQNAGSIGQVPASEVGTASSSSSSRKK